MQVYCKIFLIFFNNIQNIILCKKSLFKFIFFIKCVKLLGLHNFYSTFVKHKIIFLLFFGQAFF